MMSITVTAMISAETDATGALRGGSADGAGAGDSGALGLPLTAAA